jgi:hypothetical protein
MKLVSFEVDVAKIGQISSEGSTFYIEREQSMCPSNVLFRYSISSEITPDLSACEIGT